MSRTENKVSVWIISPFRPSDEIYFSARKSQKVSFLGVDFRWFQVRKDISCEVWHNKLHFTTLRMKWNSFHHTSHEMDRQKRVWPPYAQGQKIKKITSKTDFMGLAGRELNFDHSDARWMIFLNSRQYFGSRQSFPHSPGSREEMIVSSQNIEENPPTFSSFGRNIYYTCTRTWSHVDDKIFQVSSFLSPHPKQSSKCLSHLHLHRMKFGRKLLIPR